MIGILASPAATIRVPNDYPTIQAAIAAANSGDVVRVFAGTYTGPIYIDKDLVLIGSGPDTATIIVPPGDFASNPGYNSPDLTGFRTERPVVHIGNPPSSITVAFKGFTVDMQRQGPATAQGVAYSGILAEMCNVTIDSNRVINVLPADSAGSTWNPGIDAPNGRGIHVRGSGSVAMIRGNYLENINRLHILINAADYPDSPPSVYPTATVSSDTIVGKGPYNGGQKGIWFHSGAWGTIQGNTLSNLDYPVTAIEPDRATGIVNRYGYYNTSNHTRILGNTLTSSTFVNNKGIYDQGRNDTVDGNVVTGFRYGIEIHDAQNVLVARNTVTGGQMGVLINTERGIRPDTIVVGGAPSARNIITGQLPRTLNGFAISLSYRDPNGDNFPGTFPVDARYNDFGVYTTDTIAARIFDRADTGLVQSGGLTGPIDTVFFWPFIVRKVTASVKVFLQGPYNTSINLMNNTLNTGGYLASHFSGRPIPALAVDSICVELRDSAKVSKPTKVLRVPAWLLTDGTIRDSADTKSYIELADTVSGYYHCVVWHRNHLGIMSPDSNRFEGGTNPIPWDFSIGQGQAYGANPMIAVGTRYAMVSGDASANGQVQTSDILSFIRPKLGAAGYFSGDTNLNGQVQTTDILTYTRPNLGRGTQVP